jgi:hypothetical protein
MLVKDLSETIGKFFECVEYDGVKMRWLCSAVTLHDDLQSEFMCKCGFIWALAA